MNSVMRVGDLCYDTAQEPAEEGPTVWLLAPSETSVVTIAGKEREWKWHVSPRTTQMAPPGDGKKYLCVSRK